MMAIRLADEPKYCARCGSPLPKQARFCIVCGVPVQASNGLGNNATAGKVPLAASRRRRPARVAAILITVLVLTTTAILFLAGVLPLPFQNHPAETTKASTSIPETTAKPDGLPADLSTSEILDYFEEIALKREYGGSRFDGVVCRWEEEIKVKIEGDYTADDYDWLLAHIDDLNSLGCLPEISVVTIGANYHVHFTRLDRLAAVIPGYVPGNWGFISLNWDSHGQIYLANMGIATDVTNQQQRNHLILEEFTQGLGLLNDSPQYPDSIFQIEWTEIQSLSVLDEWVIRLLYSPAVYAGMQEGVRDSLTGWLLAQ